MSVDDRSLARMAQKLRRHSLEMTAEAASGHPTTCMSCAEIVSVLFFDEMRFDPRDPSGRDQDVFVLSKGHAAPILWAALKEAGAIGEDLLTLRRFDSPLEGHPTPNSPWVRVATGSLGQGLAAAAGMAWARKLDGSAARVYTRPRRRRGGGGIGLRGRAVRVLQQARQPVRDPRHQSPRPERSHDVPARRGRLRRPLRVLRLERGGGRRPRGRAELRDAFARARAAVGKPSVIVARTLKGKGVSFLEDKDGWHGKPVKKGDELQKAVAELGDTSATLTVEPRRYPSPARPSPGSKDVTPAYTLGQEVATREAYGAALAKLGRSCPEVVGIDADTKNSTFAEKLKDVAPERFSEGYIAEQNMVGAALGMATEGKIPFASTFACFFTRAYDFIRMAAYSRPPHLVLVGSHAGVSIGEDGPSQMALEDLAMMRAITAATVLYPSDAVSAEKLTAEAAKTPGLVYIRTSRPKTKVIYGNDEAFPVGGSKTLRSSDRRPGDRGGGRRHRSRSPGRGGSPGEGGPRRARDRPLLGQARRREEPCRKRPTPRSASSPSRTTACAGASEKRWPRRLQAEPGSRSWASATSRARASRWS